MKSPNPFSSKVPPQPTRVRAVILLVLSVQAVGLSLLLMQGCKPSAQAAPPSDTSSALADTNITATNEALLPATNLAPLVPATQFVAAVSVPTNPLPLPASVPAPTVAPRNLALASADTSPALGKATYTVLAGDTFYKIAVANHVSIRALKGANPGVSPRKLKIGQVINLPQI